MCDPASCVRGLCCPDGPSGPPLGRVVGSQRPCPVPFALACRLPASARRFQALPSVSRRGLSLSLLWRGPALGSIRARGLVPCSLGSENHPPQRRTAVTGGRESSVRRGVDFGVGHAGLLRPALCALRPHGFEKLPVPQENGRIILVPTPAALHVKQRAHRDHPRTRGLSRLISLPTVTRRRCLPLWPVSVVDAHCTCQAALYPPVLGSPGYSCCPRCHPPCSLRPLGSRSLSTVLPLLAL